MTDTTDHPSRRAGLRDEIARALEAADYRMDMRRGDLADAVLPVLYREWPWLRAEAEDAASVVVPAADRAALRDRIAAALARLDAEKWGVEIPPKDHPFWRMYPMQADAVLSVLPAPADRAAEEHSALKRAHVALAEQAGRDQAALARVRRLHDALDAETDLTSPGDEITRGAAARKIAAALDGWTDPAEVRRLAEAAVDRVAAETPPAETLARRGDAWEAWLKVQRDEHPRSSHAWFMVDCVLDRYRLHADMGVPLTGHVCEARVVGDCECLEPGPVVEAQPGKDTETPQHAPGTAVCCPDCRAKGHAVCMADKARIVGYRSRDGRLLYCTGHAGELFGLGYTAVTADDLPDGGICTHPDCGVDVLIPQQPKEAKPPVGYSGKGRLWCLTCPRPDREDVPMTIGLVYVGELCAGCGRDVIDVARAAEQQPKEG
ncbi:hypothetical protein PV402_39520 [Streptomyces scabiei]|uniref:hypothetical protein n=1 Tax=Streptomyces scabiei TaxID=1930 RepID=UPI0029A7D3C7|nr:hypothetical protein [Streptomyces scabiei]MDX2658278.1 hypothetical protein [Streptomyces scabiei]MDX2870563.1 hypothetical protein [Streptomyces scabiei]